MPLDVVVKRSLAVVETPTGVVDIREGGVRISTCGAALGKR
jgi:hypothetical protein